MHRDPNQIADPALQDFVVAHRLDRRFPPQSCLSRRATGTFMPPYVVFSLQKTRGADAVLVADLGHSQPVDVYFDPVYLIAPMIFVPVKRLF